MLTLRCLGINRGAADKRYSRILAESKQRLEEMKNGGDAAKAKEDGSPGKKKTATPKKPAAPRKQSGSPTKKRKVDTDNENEELKSSQALEASEEDAGNAEDHNED